MSHLVQEALPRVLMLEYMWLLGQAALPMVMLWVHMWLQVQAEALWAML